MKDWIYLYTYEFKKDICRKNDKQYTWSKRVADTGMARLHRLVIKLLPPLSMSKVPHGGTTRA